MKTINYETMNEPYLNYANIITVLVRDLATAMCCSESCSAGEHWAHYGKKRKDLRGVRRMKLVTRYSRHAFRDHERLYRTYSCSSWATTLHR
jgi:hypothetical protein